MNKSIKGGIIGCVGIADRWTIPGMMETQNTELVVVMDSNLESTRRVKDKYGAKILLDKYSIF